MFKKYCGDSLYIIGDVHGCYDTLLSLIEKLPNKNAKLVFVGDLIDKGEKSAQVIEYVKKNNHDCILGNHEIMMMQALKDRENKEYFYNWKMFGGMQTMESYKDCVHNIKEHLQWLETLPYYLKFDLPDENGYRLLVTHGAGLPFYDMLDDAKEEITTNRIMADNDYSIINVFGHNPFVAVKFYKNYIGIDTGCVYGKDAKAGYLSAIEWNSKKDLSTRIYRIK